MRRWNYKQDKDFDNVEKVGKMSSRGKRARTSKKSLSAGFVMKEDNWPTIDKAFAARVVEVHKNSAFLSREDEVGKVETSDVWYAKIAGKFFTADRQQRNFICVGDRVFCRPAEGKEREQNSDLPQAVILHRSPRSSLIARQDPVNQEREHVLASNVDQLLVVASFLAPRIKWGLIDRYLVLAELQRIEPLILLNKYDLLKAEKKINKEFYNEAQTRVEYYRSMGYRVFILQANHQSAKKDSSVIELANALKDKVSMFSGHSGVGKSSIVNLFEPQIVQNVESDANIFYKGRHTTTYASFIKLGTGGYVIDTPGIRSFVIENHSPIELSYGYRDIRPVAEHCKFRECRHIDEPNCAVLEALSQGHLADWRYRNYVGILLGTSGREGRMRDQLRGRGEIDDNDWPENELGEEE